MLFVVCILTALQAYAIPWIIPGYKKMGAAVATEPQVSTGFMYLLILAAALVLIVVAVVLIKRKHEGGTIRTQKSKEIDHGGATTRHAMILSHLSSYFQS